MITALIIPSLTLGWFRGRAIGKAYRSIYADLKKAGINPSNADRQLLIGQLSRMNPKVVLEAEGNPEARAIKQRHVESLLAFNKILHRCVYILVAAAVLLVVSFPHFWQKK